ncbi:uncharacterized protein PGTG_00695 [Puccinia graminis f. sp. tritici CRL 75-36-700-3]|uniref:Uncharacterized protein n=1 Tax=Puccinia graminis f. sp. tritici (strain CRL 75-36-700-3 / race SCCL) TaxID=418459 RepID=E3JR73_PUCGT|nr:uncharacterized protein PGTG_00695 [Puccinia graminis f. sp. tritici CRL 75-36-700-3]EFP74739.1 hypothetical protein PGTG_00695 [Puccinia graminis f. sp. tritici CRL 75-36-700-3]
MADASSARRRRDEWKGYVHVCTSVGVCVNKDHWVRTVVAKITVARANKIDDEEKKQTEGEWRVSMIRTREIELGSRLSQDKCGEIPELDIKKDWSSDVMR